VQVELFIGSEIVDDALSLVDVAYIYMLKKVSTLVVLLNRKLSYRLLRRRRRLFCRFLAQGWINRGGAQGARTPDSPKFGVFFSPVKLNFCASQFNIPCSFPKKIRKKTKVCVF